MAAYLTLAQFKIRTELPEVDIDWLESAYSGFLSSKLEECSGWIDARLRKRYAVEEWAAAPPSAVLRWLGQMVTHLAWQKRGGDPAGDVSSAYKEAADAARTEVKEAADSEEGLFDLPLRQGSSASGISKAGPFGYSEASPYAWTDVQAEAVRNGGS